MDVIIPPLQTIHSSKAQTFSTTHPNVHMACMRVHLAHGVMSFLVAMKGRVIAIINRAKQQLKIWNRSFGK